MRPTCLEERSPQCRLEAWAGWCQPLLCSPPAPLKFDRSSAFWSNTGWSHLILGCSCSLWHRGWPKVIPSRIKCQTLLWLQQSGAMLCYQVNLQSLSHNNSNEAVNIEWLKYPLHLQKLGRCFVKEHPKSCGMSEPPTPTPTPPRVISVAPLLKVGFDDCLDS